MNVRETALFLLDEIDSSGKYVNLSLSSHMTDKLSREERAFLTSLLYTTVERRLTYDYYICAISGRSAEKINAHTMNILRLGVCQIVAMDSIPSYAAVSMTVKLARNSGEKSFVNAVLRRTSEHYENGTLPLPDRRKNEARYLSVNYSYPLQLVKHFISLYGVSETEKLFDYFNNAKYTDITVNTLKTTGEALIKLISDQGYNVAESGISSLSLRIEGSVNPTLLKGFEEGLFFVQDSASAAAVLALGIEQGDTVADVCACPGGKSFAAAICNGDSARVLSMDIHDSKLSLIEKGRDRLGILSLDVLENDAERSIESLHGCFDKVICDVPCSGYGVLGKKPDLRYKDNQSVQNLPELQYSILTESVKYLKKGGYILYSTCTLNPRENEENIHRFLAENEGFSSVDFTVGERSSADGMMTFIPHIDRCDGFFAAKIKKD